MASGGVSPSSIWPAGSARPSGLFLRYSTRIAPFLSRMTAPTLFPGHKFIVFSSMMRNYLSHLRMAPHSRQAERCESPHTYAGVGAERSPLVMNALGICLREETEKLVLALEHTRRIVSDEGARLLGQEDHPHVLAFREGDVRFVVSARRGHGLGPESGQLLVLREGGRRLRPRPEDDDLLHAAHEPPQVAIDDMVVDRQGCPAILLVLADLHRADHLHRERVEDREIAVEALA